MLVELNPQDPRPIYVQIMSEVRRALVVGTLGPDEPLPSVRRLAGDLRVNPNTVQQAYRELEREGVVYVRRGQGTFASRETGEEADRSVLREEVARRAMRDARRHGLSAADLVASIREIDRKVRDADRSPDAGGDSAAESDAESAAEPTPDSPSESPQEQPR